MSKSGTAPVDEFIHACHIPKLPDESDAVVVKTHRHFPDGRVEPHLEVIKKPHRSFYLTKPAFRDHEFKKEWEKLERLDRYDVSNYELTDKLRNALNPGWNSRRGFQPFMQLCDSPYVYGADISIEVLIKHKYMKLFEASGLKPTELTTGFFDIEKDVLGREYPNVITVTHENRVYTAILAEFFRVKQLDGSYRPGNLDEFVEFSRRTLDHHINELIDDHVEKNPKSNLKTLVATNPFQYFFYVGKSVIDIIRWIFVQIHRNKTDFIGIWNLGYDIPEILDTIKSSGVSYESILCPPDLDDRYKYVRYQKDNSDVDSIFKLWHWLHATSYSQFVDSQNLFSILRPGRETSMKLNDILAINDLGGKLTFKDGNMETETLSDLDWHRYMQENEPYQYIVYNQFDCIGLRLMELKNGDISSMMVLGGVSRLCKWPRQTRKIADAFYFYGLESGVVIASPGQNMETEFDTLIKKVGGAVLRPELTTDIGMRVFSDRPDIITMLHPFTGDIDFSGMYPNSTIVGNICKETKISCGVEIIGMDVSALWNYYSLVVSMRENAIQIGETYYGLPGYTTMDDRFSRFLEMSQ